MLKRKYSSGSITLEACIVVPVFVMLMLLVNGLFVMFTGQQIVAHTLLQSTKSLALDPYASGKVGANTEDSLADMFVDIFSHGGHGNLSSTEKWYHDHPDDIEELAGKRFAAYLRASHADADNLLKEIGIEGGVSGLDFSESKYDDGSGILTVKVNYTQNYVFNALGLASFDRSLTVRVKPFLYKG